MCKHMSAQTYFLMWNYVQKRWIPFDAGCIISLFRWLEIDVLFLAECLGSILTQVNLFVY